MIQQTAKGTPRMDLADALEEFNSDDKGLIAMDVLPGFGVKKKAATVSVISRENLKLADTKHANGAAFARVGLNAGDLSYGCVDHGLEGPVTDVDKENYASDFDAEVATSDLVKNKILIAREIRVAAKAFDTGVFTGGDLFTDWSAAPWDAAESALITHVDKAIQKVRKNFGVKADSMAIGAVTLSNMKANTGIKAMFPGAPLITLAMIVNQLAAILGLKNIFVGEGIYDGEAEGQDFAGSDIWSDDYALIFKQHNGAHLKEPGLGRSMQWEPFSGEEIAPTSYREEQTESDIIRVRDFVDEKLFNPYCGHLIKIDA